MANKMKHFQLTIYIAGPMTGLPDFNYPAFFEAAKELSAEGHAVLNPAKNSGKDWIDYMRQSLQQISAADGMFMLKGWETSKGARIEHQLAKDLGLRIRYQEPQDLKQADAARKREAELKSMQAAGASTADLGRELTKPLMMQVPYADLNLVLKRVEAMSPVHLSPEQVDASIRLRNLTL